MDKIKEMGRSFKETFIPSLDEKDQPASTLSTHRRDKNVMSSNPASGLEHRSVRNTSNERTVNPSDGKGGKYKSHRRSQKENELNQPREECLAETTEAVNVELQLQLTERKQQLQVQKSRNSKLKLELGKKQAENEQLKQLCDNIQADNEQQHFYTNRYKHIFANYIQLYAQEKGLHYDDRDSDTIRFVMEPMLKDANQAVTLQHQVHELQQELIERAGKTNATSDDHLAQDYFSLAAQIKTLSRQIKPTEGTDVVDALELGGLASGTSKHHWSGRRGSRRMIEAWCWSLLIASVFGSPFSIFGDPGQTAHLLWMTMFGSQQYGSWPLPTSESENWRQATMEQMTAMVGEDILAYGDANSSCERLAAAMMDTRANIVDVLKHGLALITLSVDTSLVLQIVDKAFTLAKHMALQRSRLQITYPRAGDAFSKIEMSPVEDDEDNEAQYGNVASIINPGLTKWGDSHGKNFDQRYEIVRALVQPEPLVYGTNGVSLI